jgi:TatA/E family protein of Tat protein translocase
MNIGPTELVIILVIALIVFGPRKLPELGKSLGQAMAQFRRASDDFKRSWEQEVENEKARLNEIKSDVQVDLGYGAGDDFNYSADPSRGEVETASAEHTTEGSTEAGHAESTVAAPEVKEVVAPEPATATVARSNGPARNDPWI